MKERTIIKMTIGEIGYAAPWAVGKWNWLPYPQHLDGLNLTHHVFPVPTGTANMLICRAENGWIAGGKFFREIGGGNMEEEMKE